MVILELIHASEFDLAEDLSLLAFRINPGSTWSIDDS